MDSFDWPNRHKDFKAAIDADQVEIRAMLEGLASVESGIEDERISGVVNDQLRDSGNSWEERQGVIETLSGGILEELGRRKELMKDLYPFEIDGGSLNYKPSQTGVYEFCLAVARNPRGTSKDMPHAAVVFEFISRDVLALYIGDGAQGFRSGWPPHESEQRGSRIKDTFTKLSKLCGELCWNPTNYLDLDPDPQLLKDAGLDVVVWKPWPDSRLGQLFALGQCACGKNDVAGKAAELNLKRLREWLRPLSYVEPVRCFLAAHHIPNTSHLFELSRDGGLVFDRARIALLAESGPHKVKPIPGFDYHKLAIFYANQQVA